MHLTPAGGAREGSYLIDTELRVKEYEHIICLAMNPVSPIYIRESFPPIKYKTRFFQGS